MHINPKLDALQRQRQKNHVERLFGKDPPPPPPPPAVAAAETRAGAEVGGEEPAEGDVVRNSYIILRGRIEALPSLELRNSRGQTRLIPWHYFGGASLDHPGELMLIFDGPEGSCQVTLRGRGLDVELLEGVKAQKVSLICELTELEAGDVARRDPAAPVVTGIGIKGGGREWGRPAGHSR